jgi:hypothetical protein
MADTKTQERLLPTQAFVTRQRKGEEAETVEETLEIHQFATNAANVSVEMGMTINLGNYESAKVSVSLSVPCYQEEVDRTFAWAKKWVEEKTLEEAAEARGFAKARADDSDPF